MQTGETSRTLLEEWLGVKANSADGISAEASAESESDEADIGSDSEGASIGNGIDDEAGFKKDAE